jgi:cell division protein FtsB
MLAKKNNIIQKLLANQVFLSIVGLVIIILISIPLAKNVSQRYRTNNDIINLQKEISAQEKNNSLLKNMISYKQSDQFVEEKARLNLGYKKPGEQLVIIQKQNATDNIGSANEIDSLAQGNNQANSNFLKWMKYFFKNNF